MLLVVPVVLGLGACGKSGGSDAGDAKKVAPNKVTTKGVIAPDGFKPVDLKGLDVPTKLSGKCFTSYVVIDGGLDAAKTQHYILSFEVKSGANNTVELFQFLDKNKCGAQQRAAHDKAADTLDLQNDGTVPDPFETSYRTTGGRRIFL
jgi:hypothetical protein